MNIDIKELDSKLLECKSSKQVIKLLKDLGIKYSIDDEMVDTAIRNGTPKTKAIWVDIMISRYSKIVIDYSKWDKCFETRKYHTVVDIPNGKKRVIPTCYGFTTEIDDYDTIILE
jgi:hypothetical protein